MNVDLFTGGGIRLDIGPVRDWWRGACDDLALGLPSRPDPALVACTGHVTIDKGVVVTARIGDDGQVVPGSVDEVDVPVVRW